MRWYINQNFTHLRSHIGKAKIDVQTIMKEMGYTNVGREFVDSDLPMPRLYSILAALRNFRGGDMLVIQYPFSRHLPLILGLAKIVGVKVVLLVHEIIAPCVNLEAVRKEMKIFNNAHYIIVINPRHRDLFKEAGCTTPISVLGPYDYLSDAEPLPRSLAPGETIMVNYASSEIAMARNGFLYQWGEAPRDYLMKTYVKGFNPSSVTNHATWKHSEEFDDYDYFISNVEGHFGLLWDGSSLNMCTGEWGENIRFNAPHKFSYYIRAHLPLVVWDEAACADYVTKNNLGITVGSLFELNDKLKQVTPEGYAAMVKNVTRLSDELKQGTHLRKALKEAEQYLKINS